MALDSHRPAVKKGDGGFDPERIYLRGNPAVVEEIDQFVQLRDNLFAAAGTAPLLLNER